MHAKRLARLIIFERTGRWAVGLRRHLADAALVIREVRSQAHCLEALAESQASLVGIELSAETVSQVVNFVQLVSELYPRSRVFVVGPSATQCFDGIVREAGAVHAIFSPLQLRQLARLVERFLAAAEIRDRTFREAVFDRLPWGDASAGGDSFAIEP